MFKQLHRQSRNRGATKKTIKQLRRQRKSSPTSQIQSSIKENSRTERVIADMLVASRRKNSQAAERTRRQKSSNGAATAIEENSSTAGADMQQQQQKKKKR